MSFPGDGSTRSEPDVRFVTDRLLVPRRWGPADRDGYAALNTDPDVMHYLGAPLSRERSDALAAYGDAWAERGRGLLPVRLREPGPAEPFLGMCGLHQQRWYPDEVEVGWRFARHAWGHGYATEAAARWLDEAFGPLDLDHVISIVHVDNDPSRAVTRRLGMRERERAEHIGADGEPVPVVVFATTRGDWSSR